MNHFYLDQYIKAHDFKLIDSITYSGITQLEISEQPTTNNLYEVKGIQWNDEWKYVLERETGKLWVEIIYD